MVVEIDPPPYTKSLVVGGLMVADSMVSLSITEDRGILDNSDSFNDIKGASAKIYEEGLLFAELQEVDRVANYGNSTTIYLSYEKPKVGKSYTLEIEKSGFENVTATDKIPNPPVFEIGEVSVDFVYRDTLYRHAYFMIEITIDDDIAVDYYHLIATAHYKELNEATDDKGEKVSEISDVSSEIKLDTDELVFEDHMRDYAVFTDQGFNGKNHKIKLDGYIYNEFIGTDLNGFDQDLKIVFELRKISEVTYNFMNTTQLHKRAERDPITEPAQVYSNVENGNGIFGSYNSSFIEFTLELKQ